MLRARQKLDLRRLQRLQRDLQTSTGAVEEARKDCADLYRDFIVRRFVLFSYGAGTWPHLKQSRIKKKGHSRILVDTRFLLQKLAAIIDIVRETHRSLFMGFRSTIRHPTAKMQVAELAEIHNSGLGNNPKRPILVEPDNQTNKMMASISVKRFLSALSGEKR